MSTLTVCPYCGEAMRFDSMKYHLLSCEGRSPLPKSQPRSQSSTSPSPPKAKPVSGLEFYNQLNKLSMLTRSKSGSGGRSGHHQQITRRSGGGDAFGGASSGHAAPPHSAAAAAVRVPVASVSAEQQEAAIVRQLMYPSTSLTIDVAPSRSRSSAATSSTFEEEEEQTGEEARRRPSGSWAAPSAMDVISPLASPPPPAVHVNLTQPESSGSAHPPPSQQPHHREETSEVREPPRLSAAPSSSSRRSASALTSTSAGGQRGKSGSGSMAKDGHTDTVPSVGAAVHSSRSMSARNDDGARALAAESAAVEEGVERRSTSQAPHGGNDSSGDGPSRRRLRSQSAQDSKASAKSSSETGGSQRDRTSADSAAATSKTSRASSHRPAPQLSSFAIRLRGSGAASAHPTEESTSEGYVRAVHGNGDVSDGGRPLIRAEAAAPVSSELTMSVAQLRESVQQVQRVVQKQQEQYNALLLAHADLTRQVSAQQGSCSGLVRRSMEQAAAVEMALQRHTREWHGEQAALTDSVAALWANVAEVQQRLHQSPRALPLPPPVPPSPPLQQLLPSRQVPPAEAAPDALDGAAPPAQHASHASSVTASSLRASQRQQQHQQLEQQAIAHLRQQLHEQTRSESHAPVISIQRAAPAEESAYYSDIAFFIQQHHQHLGNSATALSTSDASEKVNTAGSSLSHWGEAGRHVSGGSTHTTIVTDVQQQQQSQLPPQRGAFAHIPTATYTGTPGKGVTPPALRRPFISTASSGSPSRESSVVHVTHRSSTLPRSPAFAVGVQQQQQHHPPPPSSQALMEDRVMAMLHAKPNVVVQHSPWK